MNTIINNNQSVLQAQINALMAENARLKAQAPKPKAMSFKVSAKGAVSVYGLGRFPVTLYKSQWARLMAVGSELAQFIQANDSVLKEKGE
jgi:hypothetical protein